MTPATSRGAAPAAPRRDGPDPDSLTVRAVLLASEEREIPTGGDRPRRAHRQALGRARARVHDRAHLGHVVRLPQPGAEARRRREWDQQRHNVEKAIGRLERKGVEADGRVVGTRAGAKRIVQEARRLGCDAIVMGADPPRSSLIRDFIWSQEPYRVRRRARVPVYLVVDQTA